MQKPKEEWKKQRFVERLQPPMPSKEEKPQG